MYPLKFEPIPHEMIWGGNSLQKYYNKPFPGGKNIGESWEISAVPGNISVVANGHLKGNNLKELIEVYMDELVGEEVFNRFGVEFPLLIKLIDARDKLSVQVHPGDELSARRHNGNGKTEMWYVLAAENEPELISGFNRKVSSGIFMEKLNSGRLLDILNVEKVREGDVFFIPSGRVHAIGKGIILAEIQQTSDITYRIYDWDRVDEKGKPRELHIDLAMEAIDFEDCSDFKTTVKRKQNFPVLLADCEYFTTQLLTFRKDLVRDYSLIDSFVIYLCTKGEFIIECNGGPLTVQKGETVLIPSSIQDVKLTGKVESDLLEVYIRQVGLL